MLLFIGLTSWVQYILSSVSSTKSMYNYNDSFSSGAFTNKSFFYVPGEHLTSKPQTKTIYLVR